LTATSNQALCKPTKTIIKTCNWRSDALEPPAVELPIKKPLTSSQNFNDLFNCENEPKLDESVGGKGKVRKNMQKNNVQINFKKMADSGYIQGEKIGNLPQQLQDNNQNSNT
jgi:hypothetical protein